MKFLYCLALLLILVLNTYFFVCLKKSMNKIDQIANKTNEVLTLVIKISSTGYINEILR